MRIDADLVRALPAQLSVKRFERELRSQAEHLVHLPEGRFTS